MAKKRYTRTRVRTPVGRRTQYWEQSGDISSLLYGRELKVVLRKLRLGQIKLG